MGAWGILERQSDNGLDLLDLIVAEQLRKVDFAAFNVAEAVKLLHLPQRKSPSGSIMRAAMSGSRWRTAESLERTPLKPSVR